MDVDLLLFFSIEDYSKATAPGPIRLRPRRSVVREHDYDSRHWRPHIFRPCRLVGTDTVSTDISFSKGLPSTPFASYKPQFSSTYNPPAINPSKGPIPQQSDPKFIFALHQRKIAENSFASDKASVPHSTFARDVWKPKV